MARSTPPLARLCDLAPRDYADFFALLASRTRNTTREGDPFYHCRFQDARRSVTFMVWANGPWFEVCENEWHEGLFYKIRGVYLEHEKYGPQIDIQSIRPATEADRAQGFDERNLVEHSRRAAAEMLAELRTLVETAIEDEPLRRLVLLLLERHALRLQRLPATRDKFFPFPGGWLEHTLSVTQHALLLVDSYRLHYPELKPPLNKDLVVAGAVLHDIGRVLEYDESFPTPVPTVAGRLLGHLFLGRDLVRETAREVENLDQGLLELLEHILVSHLTLPDMGSPRLPHIPEVLIIHHLDDLDAKLEMYVRCLTRDNSPGPFTARDPLLNNRRLYKGRER